MHGHMHVAESKCLELETQLRSIAIPCGHGGMAMEAYSGMRCLMIPSGMIICTTSVSTINLLTAHAKVQRSGGMSGVGAVV